jgi:hypothetical protein
MGGTARPWPQAPCADLHTGVNIGILVPRPPFRRSPSVINIPERVVAKLRRQEDGSLSNPKVEQYALLRSEGPTVISMTAAWTVIMRSGKGHLPSGQYQAKVHQSPAFKRRLEELMAEKEALEAEGALGALEWQFRQIYRRACAMNDLDKQLRSSDQLMKLLLRKEPKEPAAPKEPSARGRGAPTVEEAMPEVPDQFSHRLLDIQ